MAGLMASLVGRPGIPHSDDGDVPQADQVVVEAVEVAEALPQENEGDIQDNNLPALGLGACKSRWQF
jgi:hypothetical protein